MRSTSFGSEGCFDLMRTALESTTVEIAFRPAARIVSPDSTLCEATFARARMRSRTNQVYDAICDAQGARSLDAAPDVLDRGPQLGSSVDGAVLRLVRRLGFQLPEVLFRQVDKAGADMLSNEVARVPELAPLRDLHLQAAFAEAEVQDFLDARRRRRRRDHLVLAHLVAPGDAQVDAALADKRRDVGRREEDQRNAEVLDQSNVEAVVPVEVYVGAMQQVEARVVEAALLGTVNGPRRGAPVDSQSPTRSARSLLLGTANSSRSFRLLPQASVSMGIEYE